MKHNLKITAILLGMFIITQFLGLYVVDTYATTKIVNGEQVNVTAPQLPYGMQPPAVQAQSDFYTIFVSIIIAFIIAIFLMLLLSKLRAEFFLKLWFFIVMIIALAISINAFLIKFNIALKYVAIVAILISLPLAFFKVYKRNFLIHNFTELLIYPGIAAVFVPILNIWTIILLLVIISIYDMWAVWHSGFMQKMAKYQIEELKVFAGFFIPTVSDKVKEQIKTMKKSDLKKKTIKINLAILGGGDVVFPIITAGVVLKTLGLWPAIFVIIGATLGLSYLLYYSEKKKFYPAMPFITTGMFLALALAWILMRFVF